MSPNVGRVGRPAHNPAFSERKGGTEVSGKALAASPGPSVGCHKVVGGSPDPSHAVSKKLQSQFNPNPSETPLAINRCFCEARGDTQVFALPDLEVFRLKAVLGTKPVVDIPVRQSTSKSAVDGVGRPATLSLPGMPGPTFNCRLCPIGLARRFPRPLHRLRCRQPVLHR